MFIAIVLKEIAPFQLAGLRFSIAGILMISYYIIRYGSINIPRVQLKNSLIAGFLFLTLGNGGVSWALQYIDTGFTALLIAAQPLVVILLMYLLEKKSIQVISMVGVVLGVIGIYLLVGQDVNVHSSTQWIGVGIVFACLLAWGWASLFVAKNDFPSLSLNSGIQMLSAGFCMSIIGFIFEEVKQPFNALEMKTLASMCFLIIFGSIIAFSSFNYLLKHVSAEKVATSTYVNPIIAMLLGWYFLGEIISNRSLLAALILLLGVYFINVGKMKVQKKDG